MQPHTTEYTELFHLFFHPEGHDDVSQYTTKLLHPLNASELMVVTFIGIKIVSSITQPEKAELPMLVTPSPRVTVLRT